MFIVSFDTLRISYITLVGFHGGSFAFSLQIPFNYGDKFCFHVWFTSLLNFVLLTSCCLKFYCMALSGFVPGVNLAF